MPDVQTVSAGELLGLLEQQKYRCALSGRELTPSKISVDHKVPVSRGGEHTIANLMLVAPEINFAKGTMTIDEFLAMCHDVAALHPRQATL